MYCIIRENDRSTAQRSCPYLQVIMHSAVTNRISVLKIDYHNLLNRCKSVLVPVIRSSGGLLLFCTVAFIIYLEDGFCSRNN